MNAELIPLNNHRFALVDGDNKIIQGDKKDFIEYIELLKGFTVLKPLK